MTADRFGVVIVNYNCARLALDAVFSAFGGGAHRVVVVDNASTDDTAAYFRAVASGRAPHRAAAPADAPRRVRFARPSRWSFGAVEPFAGSLSIVFANENRGFASGCNAGLKALRESGGADFYLLLNPDALLAADALAGFARRLSHSETGLCGASVLAFDPPHAAQAFGGAALDPWTLRARNIGAGLGLDAAPAQADAERKLSYPLGAAIALRAEYLDRAGYLDERYFLYFEEADWTLAGGCPPVWARDAVVYHRYGGSSKSRLDSGRAKRSPLSERHMTRSRLLFSQKWRPHLVAPLLALSVAEAASRLLERRDAAAKAILAGCRDFLAGSRIRVRKRGFASLRPSNKIAA